MYPLGYSRQENYYILWVSRNEIADTFVGHTILQRGPCE